MKTRFTAMFLGALALAAAMPCISQAAGGDTYPSRPITMVIPFPPGGTADGFARSLGQELGKRLGQPIIVENKPGANGNIGSAAVAHMPADGYTLLYASLSTLAVNPFIYPVKGYDPRTDFAPVTITHQMANVLVVGEKTQFHDVAGLIKYAKAHPGKLSFASAGIGNTMHLAAEQFLAATGTKMVHVPYKGGAGAINDILGGRIPLMFDNLPAIVQLVKAGKLRALAVADTKRSPLLPDVPTMAQAGVPGFTNVVWVGFVMRKGTDPKIIDKLSKEIRAVLDDPKFRKIQEDQGYEIIGSTPEQFAQTWKAATKDMGELTKRIGIRVN
ncbi:tripartite tricarboxylate transporter substrate binding protein [Candidimonas humi]|uniref:Bug family tripartite tricarboxylate transporter substrate binding protein n=1 Tax=Candidimonas humi TaxID=683355 RepID=A0ABV8NXI3_9BURK|nr:tripartite tricarboxylate transporter substrate binding protein [Candidimonas humi]MBV6304455.1 tripartite tricarboxylate transporter substrate binding protein [Candidimonas humi]